jgi:hypothetical protein
VLIADYLALPLMAGVLLALILPSGWGSGRHGLSYGLGASRSRGVLGG